jgi:Bacterial conjugation TrbI-like protein
MSNQINDQHRATDPSVAEMANMMDFGGGHSRTTDQHDDENAFIDVEAIEDEEDDFINEEFNPEKNATKVGFRKNGKAKGILVATTGLIAVVGGITFFQGQVPKDKIAEVPQKKDATEEKVESAQSDASKAQQSESETKAELALSKQKESLEQASTADKNKPAVATNNTNPTQVVTTPTPSVPVVPIANKNSRSGFVGAPIAQAPTPTIRAAAAPFILPASKNISIPPAGVQQLPAISAPKLATAPVGQLVNKNTSPASTQTPKMPIAAAPGATKTPTRAEPTRNIPVRDSEDSTDRPRSRLAVAPAPGLPSDNVPPPPLYPAGSQSIAIGSSVPPVAISSGPSLTDFLKTSAAADTPAEARSQAIALNKEQPKTATVATPITDTRTQVIALNKEQLKREQVKGEQPVTNKNSKPGLQIVPAPGITTIANAQTNKSTNLIASNDTINSYVSTSSGLVSPNSPLTDIVQPAPFGIQVASTKTSIGIAQPLPQAVEFSTRPAYNYSKLLIAGLPDAKMSLNLGNSEPASSSLVNQSNKAQVVTQNNPVLNQPVPAAPAPNNSVLSQPVPAAPAQNSPALSPVAPSGSLGPLASSLLTGTSAKGTTLTPILWGAESANGAKFVAKLEEPLLANNKREALPAGTQLIVMARPSNSGNSGLGNSNNSLVEVDVVGVIIQGREYSTPPGAIVIHDENNGLLVGEDYFKREDQIAGRDYMTVLGGALNTVGQVLNRPSGTFSSNTSGFGSSSTNIINNRDPNVLGALLEGGFKDIPGIWTQRNQQALAQLASQPKVYQIPKGRTIRVFVNQSINF